MNKKDFVNKTFVTNNSGETQKLGYDFARSLLAGSQGLVIALYGDLGSGKTTFVQGLAKGIGIKEKIISPTFIIIRTYPSKNFYHVDLYRIENNDLKGLGLEEILNNPQNIVVVEWAEKLKNQMPAKRIDIKFFYEQEKSRKIIFGLGL